MKTFAIDRYKGALQAREAPVPAVGETDVLVEIHAASVNPLDAKIRDGTFKLILPYRMPLILGHDLAGVVVEIGPRVTGFRVGDEVYARASDGRIGTFAESIAVDHSDLALKPKSLDMVEAAALPLVALTAWQALVEKAGLTAGRKVLIQAGSGGLGSIAIQLARSLGAHVATTTGTSNVEWVRSLGADVVVDYKTSDFSKALTGYDVVLDTQGGETLLKSARILKPGGRLIGVAGPPDVCFAERQGFGWPLRFVMRLLSRRIRREAGRRGASYSFLFMRASGEQLGEVAALVDAGAIRPVVDRVFPFDQTPEALAFVETGRAKGKVVVRVK